ncbi:MAG TPA: serine/threonine-protein kinase [Polyangiaceae bacterium]|nr:serine/threonine-protein kinase [Polyangiaceae bacterium]
MASNRLLKDAVQRASAVMQGSSAAAAIADPRREAVRRLGLLCTVASVAPVVSVSILLFVAPEGSPIRAARTMTIAIMGTVVTLSAVLRRVLATESIAIARRLDIGFAYQIVLALLVATLRNLVPWAPGDGFREVSPVALLILLFAALIPNPPRRTLAASLSAAAMEPIGLALTIWHGNPVPAPAQIVAMCVGPTVAAIAATLVSHVVYGLAKSVDVARRMGSYRLTEKLGEGGMGEVWRAEHDLLARPAAIKLIRADGASDPDRRTRFEREARATAALRSPHTVQLYDFGVTSEATFFYAMELLDGVDLERLVRDAGPMPPARAVRVLSQVCESLEEAHRQGLIHRDVKPANILLCRYGLESDFAKVLDFGLVRALAEEPPARAGSGVTQQNVIVGTPAFMAPEMATSGKADARADIYAFGCVAYWLLTGQLVFEADSPMKILVRHVHDPVEPPSSRSGAGVPEELDAIVLDCLAKEPEQRPASMAEVRARLARVPLETPWTELDAETWWREHGQAVSGTAPLELAATEIAATELLRT